MHPDVAKHQEAWGLPTHELLQRRVHYNAVADCVLLSFGRIKNDILLRDIYWRGSEETRYRQLITHAGDLSLEDVVMCQAPMACFTVSRWSGEEANMSCEDLGVARLDLRSGAYELWDCDSPHRVPRFFIAELCGVDPDGARLYAVAGFRPSGGTGLVEYKLIGFEWATKTAHIVTSFNGVFF